MLVGGVVAHSRVVGGEDRLERRVELHAHRQVEAEQRLEVREREPAATGQRGPRGEGLVVRGQPGLG